MLHSISSSFTRTSAKSTTSCASSDSFFGSILSSVLKYLTVFLNMLSSSFSTVCHLFPSILIHFPSWRSGGSSGCSPSAVLLLPTLLDSLPSPELPALAASSLLFELDASAALLLLPLLLELVLVLVGASVWPSSGLDFVRCVPLGCVIRYSITRLSTTSAFTLSLNSSWIRTFDSFLSVYGLVKHSWRRSWYRKYGSEQRDELQFVYRELTRWSGNVNYIFRWRAHQMIKQKIVGWTDNGTGDVAPVRDLMLSTLTYTVQTGTWRFDKVSQGLLDEGVGDDLSAWWYAENLWPSPMTQRKTKFSPSMKRTVGTTGGRRRATVSADEEH